jgi:hypothetical protein
VGNDVPRRICEFRNDEWTYVLHDRLGRSASKAVVVENNLLG